MPSLPFFVTSLDLLTLRHQADLKTQPYGCRCMPTGGGLDPSLIPANGNRVEVCLHVKRNVQIANKTRRGGVGPPWLYTNSVALTNLPI